MGKKNKNKTQDNKEDDVKEVAQQEVTLSDNEETKAVPDSSEVVQVQSASSTPAQDLEEEKVPT